MRSKLLYLRHHGEDDANVKLLYHIFNKIIEDPQNEKFHKFYSMKQLTTCVKCMDILHETGFSQTDDGSIFIWNKTETELDTMKFVQKYLVHNLLAKIHKENPFSAINIVSTDPPTDTETYSTIDEIATQSNIKCICGSPLMQLYVNQYSELQKYSHLKNMKINCDGCSKVCEEKEMVFHCPLKKSVHPIGYDVCVYCATKNVKLRSNYKLLALKSLGYKLAESLRVLHQTNNDLQKAAKLLYENKKPLIDKETKIKSYIDSGFTLYLNHPEDEVTE
eukprot:161000_1